MFNGTASQDGVLGWKTRPQQIVVRRYNHCPFDSWDAFSVKGAAANTTTTINAARARLKGFIIGVGAGNGTVTFNDGGSAVFNVAVIGGTSDVSMNIPENGVLFKSNLNVTTVNTTVNVFYTGA